MRTLPLALNVRLRRVARLSFTLIELLVVISIIATMFALLTPALKSAKEKARSAQCTSNMKQFGMAFQMYADTHNGWLPRNWMDNSYNWQSMLVDQEQGGNYFSGSNSMRSIILGWTPVAIRVKAKLLCPTVVNAAISGPDGTIVRIVDPHDQWGYSYNHLRGSVSWEGEGWPWWTASLHGVDTRVLYRSPSKYIIMCDGNGANYDPDDWNATTGNLATFNYPIQPVHGDGINALYLDGHVQYMPIKQAADITTFNRAFYGGIPIGGNPYVND